MNVVQAYRRLFGQVSDVFYTTDLIDLWPEGDQILLLTVEQWKPAWFETSRIMRVEPVEVPGYWIATEDHHEPGSELSLWACIVDRLMPLTGRGINERILRDFTRTCGGYDMVCTQGLVDDWCQRWRLDDWDLGDTLDRLFTFWDEEFPYQSSDLQNPDNIMLDPRYLSDRRRKTPKAFVFVDPWATWDCLLDTYEESDDAGDLLFEHLSSRWPWLLDREERHATA